VAANWTSATPTNKLSLGGATLMMTIIPIEKLKSMLMISRPAKSRNFSIVIYGILGWGMVINAAMGRWRHRSVASGGFDEMENINKIICQNISKQL